MGMQQHFKGHWEVDNDGFTCYEEQGTTGIMGQKMDLCVDAWSL